MVNKKKLFFIIIQVFLLFIGFGLIFYSHNDLFSRNNYAHDNENIKENNENRPIIDVYFSPVDDIRSILCNYIAKETKEILCAAYRMTDKVIVAELLKAHRRGVKITLIVDQDGFAGTYNKVLYLFQEGVKIYIFPPLSESLLKKNKSKRNDVKINSMMALMHNKFLIFASQDIVITGSYNYTAAAAEKNKENIVVIKSKLIMQKYQEQFKKICVESSLVKGNYS